LTPKRIAIAIVVLVLVIVVGRWLVAGMFSSGETHSARVRVTELFDALRGGPATDFALERWYGGRRPSHPDLLGALNDEFEAWCTQHKLRPMRGFEIREARETGEKDRFGAVVVLVSGVANDEPFRLRVQRGQTITWVD
jgi:hypothetical protein